MMATLPADTMGGAVDGDSTEDALLAEARALMSAGDIAEAEARCGMLLARAPASAEAHALNGCIRAMSRRFAEALDAYSRALELDRNYRPAHYDRALILIELGRLEEALLAVENVLPCDGKLGLAAHRLRTQLLLRFDHKDAALAAVEAGLASFAGDKELTIHLGTALRVADRNEEALAALEVVLREDPACVTAIVEKGWALVQLDKGAEAMEAFDLALEHDEANVSALTGMGIAEMQVGMHAAALAAFDQALSLRPDMFLALFNRALALQRVEHFQEALAAYEALLRHWPDTAEAYDNIGHIKGRIGALDDAEQAYRRALELAPDTATIRSNLLFTLLYQPGQTPATLAREHAEWVTRFGEPAGRFTDWPNDRDPDRPLRIGIVSGELWQHPVSAWLIPALESLDRRQFSLVCYATQAKKDNVSARIERLLDGWRDVYALDDCRMAELIRQDGIDILIELSGHTANNRLTCLARKPAPIQASWLGYPYPIGMPAIDYSIMDDFAVRPGEEAKFAETVVRLPGGRICYEPPADAPPVAGPPVMQNGWITFGSFNNITKVTPEVVDAWCRILRAVPASRLIVKSPALGESEVAERLQAAFVGRGLTSSRLELRAGSSAAQVLQEYGDIDIALDPFPFGGGATSCEALWMGVPIVTLPGWQPVSRQTEGFLTALSQRDWVARDVDQYVAIASSLARAPLQLIDWRVTQREAMRASALCDKSRIGRELGAALRQMWHAYVSGSRRVSSG